MDILGCCGDNCTHCPRYTATQTGSMGELEKAKDLWVRLGFRDKDFPAEKMVCNGCGQENRCAYEDLRTCVIDKSINNCGFCDEYPCDITNAAFRETEELKSRAADVCSREEMDILNKAFLIKKHYLDSIHQRQKI